MKNNTIYMNGRIYTLDDHNSVKQAIAVKNGQITAIGTNDEILEGKNEDTKIIDLKGNTVLPGICDCHVHLVAAGGSTLDIDAFDRSKLEILEEVKKRAETISEGEWITGMGWNQDYWEDTSFPTREELDKVAPNNPVRLTRYCGNAYWCNSMALELAGLTIELSKGNGGAEFLVNEQGKLLGTLVGEACKSIDKVMPSFTNEKYQDLFISAQNELLKYGVTSVMDKGSGGVSALSADCGREVVSILKEMYKNKQLVVRLYGALIGTDEFFNECFAEGPLIGLYGNKFTIRGIKLWSDGAFGPRSAWISKDYKGRKGHSGNQKFTDEELITLFKKADEKNLQIAIHSIGDASTKQVINCYEEAFADSMDKDRRFIIDHFHVPSPEDIQRLVDYKIINSTQFIQLSSDMEVIRDILPNTLIKQLYPWREVLDKGGVICNGSDAPVDPLNPFPSLYVAVSRKNLKGINIIESNPLKTLTRLEALKAYTTAAAYANFQEDLLGSLETGKFADFIVINKDYFLCPQEDIKDIKVLKTIIDGEVVYENM